MTRRGGVSVRRRHLPLAVLAGLAVVGGLTLSAFGAAALHVLRPPTPPPARGASRAQVARTTSQRVPVSPPQHIEIPSLGVSSPLGPARGLTSAGTIDDAPLSGPIWSLPWWYERGSTPGQPGSAVILGHVDSAMGAGHLGVFFRLGSLRAGQTIAVALADGVVTHWVVVSDVMYSDSHFPDSMVYGRSGPPTLRLVTCGGTFNWSTHLYESAVVVTASLVSVSNPR